MKDLKVIILAGGASSRMWPIDEKHSLSFLGLSLANHAISKLVKYGYSNIIIVVNKKNKTFFEKLKSRFNNISLSLVEQKNSQGMGGAILSCQNFISHTPILVVGPSDIYEDSLYLEFAKELETGPEGILSGTYQENYFPGGYLTVEHGLVTGIIEKPDPDRIPSNIVNFVFDYFDDGSLFLDAIKKIKTNREDLYEIAIGELIKNGFKFKFLSYKGFWGYLKYPWHILNISSYYLSQIKARLIKDAKIEKSVNIAGDVLIEDGVRVMENTKIIGPCYIGKNTIIGQNCLIRESMIGENCVVGFTSELTRSYIADYCWFHNNYIGDSVISNNVSMGGGATLANFRLDEKPIKSEVSGKVLDTGKTHLGSIVGPNVRIGVNTSIMPGVKIGKNSIIGPGVVLDSDLPDGKFCLIEKRNYIIKDNTVMISDKFRKEHGKSLNL